MSRPGEGGAPARGDGPSAAATVLDVEAIFRARGPTAMQAYLDRYEAEAQARAGAGADVVLTGRGPIWLYLRLAHALHGQVGRLFYRSPEAGDVLVFDHRSR